MKLTIPAGHGASANEASRQDTDAARIEAELHEAVVALIVAGEAQYRAAVHAHLEWLIDRKAELEEEERRRWAEEERRERERLAKLERERLERLFSAANDWRRAADLRAFVEAVRAANPDMSTPATVDNLRPLLAIRVLHGNLAVLEGEQVAAGDLHPGPVRPCPAERPL